MSQASLTIDNVTHAAYRAADNARAAAQASFQSGATAPANPVAGMFWLDTSAAPAILKQRNVANNAWGPPLLQFATGETEDADITLPMPKAVVKAMIDAASTGMVDPVAIAEGSTGAPITAAGWHPYNGTLNGTGDGKYYDFAVHGAVASVETPTFADGYEYMIILDGLTKSGPPAALNIELYRETTAAYSSAFVLLASVALASGKIEFPLARKTLPLHIIKPDVSAVTSTTPIATAGDSRVTFAHSGSQKISKARLSFSGANTSAGKLYLYRRSLQ